MAKADHAKAIKNYERALLLYRKLGSVREEAETLLELGEAYRQNEDHSRSLSTFDTAVDVSSKLGDRNLLLQALIHAAVGYSATPPNPAPSRRIALGERAIAPAERALALAQDMKEAEAEILALQILATVNSQLGLFELDSGDDLRAESHFKNELIAARKLRKLGKGFPDRGTEPEALWGLGKLKLKQGKHKEAMRYFDEALKAAQSTNSQRWEMKILHVMGMGYLVSDELRRAQKSFERQLSLAEKTRHLSSVADAQWGIGLVCLAQKRLAEGEKRLTTALVIAVATDDKQQQDKIKRALEMARSKKNA